MTKKEATNLVNSINNCFTSPFMPLGFVRSRVLEDGGIILKIGSRDLQVKKDCTFLGQETDLTAEWDIKGRKENHGISFELYKVLFALLNCFEPGQYAKTARQKNCMDWGRKVMRKAQRLGLHEAPMEGK